MNFRFMNLVFQVAVGHLSGKNLLWTGCSARTCDELLSGDCLRVKDVTREPCKEVRDSQGAILDGAVWRDPHVS